MSTSAVNQQGKVDVASQVTGVLPVVNGGVDQNAWDSWSPTVTNITVGTGGSTVGRYKMLSTKTCLFELKITLGSSGFSVGTLPYFTYPFTGLSSGNEIFGSGNIIDVSSTASYAASGKVNYAAGIVNKSTTSAYFIVFVTNGVYSSESGLSSTVPMTFAAGDIIFVQAIYEIA